MREPSCTKRCSPDDDVTISGISGRFPKAGNLQEFADNLYSNVDMIEETTWRKVYGYDWLPLRRGQVGPMDKFDAEYFGISPNIADDMNPRSRWLLELTHEAIIDAGINPRRIRSTRTGVFIGTFKLESEIWDPLEAVKPKRSEDVDAPYASTLANAISHAFDLRGPSLVLDTACSASMTALCLAVDSIRSGQCDAALVGSITVNPSANAFASFCRMNMLSPDGTSRVLDESANGYVRCESAIMIYVGKRKDSRRMYASIIHGKLNCDGYKQEGITVPSSEAQKSLMLETYQEAGLSPDDVVYMEAHLTGTQVGDPNEMKGIMEVFCESGKRKQPLLVGSVKSNMGHGEGAAGVCQLAKIIVAIKENMIPANLNFRKLNPKIPPLPNSMKIVTKNEPLQAGGLVAINSFGFGGANAHFILRPNQKRAPGKLSADLPLLVPYSGRTEESVVHMLTAQIQSQDEEIMALLQQIALDPIPGHPFRGFAVTAPGVDPILECKEVRHVHNRPVWFIFAGVGSQWEGMNKEMMKFSVFRESIERSAHVLKQFNLDLENIIFGPAQVGNDEDLLVRSNVSITAVQIALVNLLESIGIRPDGIIGHSMGEVACAYADKSFDAEQAILSAYFRAATVRSHVLDRTGAMAAVGMRWEEARSCCPEGVFAACHNALDSVTISGPRTAVSDLVERLKSSGTFAKMVDSMGYAFHSKYVAAAAPEMTTQMKRIIPNPKVRSSKWISSSVPEGLWDTDVGRTASAEYFINNLLSPVRFAEALQHIPEDALLIEIAPHSLLQAILKRSVHRSCHIVGLLNKNAPRKGAEMLLSSVGRIFNAGLHPNVTKLYKEMEYPVSARAGFLGPLVKWNHSASWKCLHPDEIGSGNAKVFELPTSLLEGTDVMHSTSLDLVLLAHCISFVWETWAEMNSTTKENLPIVIQDLNFFPRVETVHASNETEGTNMKFGVRILKNVGKFEIFQDKILQAYGKVGDCDRSALGRDTFALNSNHSAIQFDVNWKGNWPEYLASLLQAAMKSTSGSVMSIRAAKITLDPQAVIGEAKNGKFSKVHHLKYLQTFKSSGIEIRKLECTSLPAERENVVGSPFQQLRRGFPQNYSNIHVSIYATNPASASNKNTETPMSIVDFSAEDAAGTKIMGMVSGLEYSTPGVMMKWSVPTTWSLPAACATSGSYSLAYYALIVLGGLKQGWSILIQDGATSLGLALNAIALSMNCTVFNTVRSVEEKKLLQANFPCLQDETFASSGEDGTPFEIVILDATQGRGVNVVVNTGNGKGRSASAACLAHHGRLLDLGPIRSRGRGSGNRDEEDAVGMEIFLKNISYHGIQPDSVLTAKQEVRKQVQELVSQGISKGIVRPLERYQLIQSDQELASAIKNQGMRNERTVVKLAQTGNYVRMVGGGDSTHSNPIQ